MTDALTTLRRRHNQGHTCIDGRWHNPQRGDRSRCADLEDIDQALAAQYADAELAQHLRDRVHEAAHDDLAMHAVGQAMATDSPQDWADLPAEVRDGWVHTARLAVEALAVHLDGGA